jgi:hypothetical protein
MLEKLLYFKNEKNILFTFYGEIVENTRLSEE